MWSITRKRNWSPWTLVDVQTTSREPAFIDISDRQQSDLVGSLRYYSETKSIYDPMLPSELWTPYWLVSSWCYNCIPVVNLPCLGASGSRWVENLGCWRMPRISSLIPCLHSNNVLLLGLRKGWQTWPEEWSCSYRISYRLLSLEYWSTHGQMTTFTSETGRIWKTLKMTNEIWCGSSYFYCKENIFLKSFNLRTQCW